MLWFNMKFLIIKTSVANKMDKQYYEVLYYNDVFNDWMRLCHWIFDNKKDAQKYIDYNSLTYPKLKFKITDYEKPRRARTKSMGRETVVRQERVN